jgi:predicted Zn finger-like uncharacterized protein
MIVSCPDCATRYVVVDAVLFEPAKERQVRCAQCGHLWHHAPETTASEAAAADPEMKTEAAAEALPESVVLRPAPEAPTEAGGDAPTHLPAPSAAPRPSAASEPIAASRRRGARVAILGVSLLAAVLLLAALLGRDKIQTWYPPAVSIYAMLHLGDPPGAGLKVSVVPMRSADSLVINGDIVNGAAIPRQIPRLRVTLLDGNKIDLVSKVIDPPVPQLRPGATAHFNATFPHATTAAVRVDVTFAHD